MKSNRRTFLKTVGAAAAGGALLSSATPVAAHGKPYYPFDQAHGNGFAYANREADYDIRWYLVHVTQGSYAGTVSWFNDPRSGVSTHYVIENSSDPEHVQMVDESDIAYHAGGQNYNLYSLGTEHEGYVGQTIWADEVYELSARTAQWAAETYDFPMRVRRFDVAPCDARYGDGGVIGHSQVPEYDCGPNNHTDPGPTWNWAKFEGYLRRYHLDVWDSVVTSTDLSVRTGPGTGNQRVDIAPAGTSGVVTDGPVDNGGYRWYEVAYDTGVADGWSAATWLPYSRFDHWMDATTRADLSVRSGPGTGYSRIDIAPAGTSGTVIDGPVDSGGWRWWKLDYDGGISTGWSADYYLE